MHKFWVKKSFNPNFCPINFGSKKNVRSEKIQGQKNFGVPKTFPTEPLNPKSFQAEHFRPQSCLIVVVFGKQKLFRNNH